MFYRLLFSFTIVLFVHLCSYASLGADDNSVNDKGGKPVNDSIIEFFHNCVCIAHYRCSVANNFMFAVRNNFLPENLTCTNKQFVCCTKVDPAQPIPVETTPTTPKQTTPKATTPKPTTPKATTPKPTTKPEITTTTETSQLRGIDRVRECGVAKTQIGVRILTDETDSATAIPGEFPWMVEIFQKRNNVNNPYLFKCHGSLIHEKVVLTATHCIKSVVNTPQSLKIIATGLDVFQTIGTDSQNERNVKKIIRHPKYYSGGLHNDIALLILEKEYSFEDNFLNPVCLPKPNQTFTGERCLAAGWGKNSKLETVPLKKVDVPIVTSEKCQELLRKTYLGSDFNLHPSFLCAGGEEGKDTCNGDGGAPLMCLDNYLYVQTGVVSWGVGDKCGIVDQPGMYADVSKFTDWIQQELSAIGIRLEEQN